MWGDCIISKHGFLIKLESRNTWACDGCRPHRSGRAYVAFLVLCGINWFPSYQFEEGIETPCSLSSFSGETSFALILSCQGDRKTANSRNLIGQGTLTNPTFVVPCAVRLWASKEYCAKSQRSNNEHDPVEFKTLTELAAECIEAIRLPSEGKVIVMFDKFYLCDTVVKACKTQYFTYRHF